MDGNVVDRPVDATGASSKNDLCIKGLREALRKIDEALQYFWEIALSVILMQKSQMWRECVILWYHLSAHVSHQISSENLPKLDSSFVLSKNKNTVDIIAGLLLDMIK